MRAAHRLSRWPCIPCGYCDGQGRAVRRFKLSRAPKYCVDAHKTPGQVRRTRAEAAMAKSKRRDVVLLGHA
jgi:hypothetical protein